MKFELWETYYLNCASNKGEDHISVKLQINFELVETLVHNVPDTAVTELINSERHLTERKTNRRPSNTKILTRYQFLTQLISLPPALPSN